MVTPFFCIWTSQQQFPKKYIQFHWSLTLSPSPPETSPGEIRTQSFVTNFLSFNPSQDLLILPTSHSQITFSILSQLVKDLTRTFPSLGWNKRIKFWLALGLPSSIKIKNTEDGTSVCPKQESLLHANTTHPLTIKALPHWFLINRMNISPIVAQGAPHTRNHTTTSLPFPQRRYTTPIFFRLVASSPIITSGITKLPQVRFLIAWSSLSCFTVYQPMTANYMYYSAQQIPRNIGLTQHPHFLG